MTGEALTRMKIAQGAERHELHRCDRSGAPAGYSGARTRR